MPEYTGPHMKQIGLLILQPSPFCNIDCSYCYLADRQSTKQMSAQTLEQTLAWVFSSGLVREPFMRRPRAASAIRITQLPAAAANPKAISIDPR